MKVEGGAGYYGKTPPQKQGALRMRVTRGENNDDVFNAEELPSWELRPSALDLNRLS